MQIFSELCAPLLKNSAVDAFIQTIPILPVRDKWLFSGKYASWCADFNQIASSLGISVKMSRAESLRRMGEIKKKEEKLQEAKNAQERKKEEELKKMKEDEKRKKEEDEIKKKEENDVAEAVRRSVDDQKRKKTSRESQKSSSQSESENEKKRNINTPP